MRLPLAKLWEGAGGRCDRRCPRLPTQRPLQPLSWDRDTNISPHIALGLQPTRDGHLCAACSKGLRLAPSPPVLERMQMLVEPRPSLVEHNGCYPDLVKTAQVCSSLSQRWKVQPWLRSEPAHMLTMEVSLSQTRPTIRKCPNAAWFVVKGCRSLNMVSTPSHQHHKHMSLTSGAEGLVSHCPACSLAASAFWKPRCLKVSLPTVMSPCPTNASPEQYSGSTIVHSRKGFRALVAFRMPQPRPLVCSAVSMSLVQWKTGCLPTASGCSARGVFRTTTQTRSTRKITTGGVVKKDPS